MKTFKEYIKKKIKFLNSPLSFTELRGAKKVNETVDIDQFSYNELHDDDDIKPKKLSINHSQALYNYTSTGSLNTKHGHASSSNINEYLRNRAGIPGKHKVLYHIPDDVEKSVKILSSVFNPANTNRKEVRGYGAVPSIIGETLEKSKKGDIHHFAGFTSLSVSNHDEEAKETALRFTDRYQKVIPSESDKLRHIIRYHLKQNTAVSAVNHSDYSPENEMIIHHGAKIEYSHTLNDIDDITNSKVKIHHVIVHPEHTPLESYGEYAHPEKETT